MADAKTIAKDAGIKIGKVIATFLKNYIGFVIADKIKPKIAATLDEIVDEAKSGAASLTAKATDEKDVKVGVEAFAVTAAGVAEPPLFKAVIESFPIRSRDYGNDYVSYTLQAIRVDKEKNGLFVLIKEHGIRYGQWHNLRDRLTAADEHKGVVVPAVPPELPLGTYCCCLTHSWDYNHATNMKNWFTDVQSKVGMSSKSLANHFYMGDAWEQQQADKAIFLKAYSATAREYNINPYPWWYNDLLPYDEGEGVSMLCAHVVVREFLPKLLAKIPAGAPGRRALENTAAGTLIALVQPLVDGAYSKAGIPTVEAAKNGINKILDEGGQGLIDQIKPLLAKIFATIQEKMPKAKETDAKKDDDEKKPKIGDTVKTWKFEKTAVGAAFYAGLVAAGENTAKHAIWKLKETWDDALKAFFGDAIQKEIGESCNARYAASGIVQIIVEKMSGAMVHTIRAFTTVGPLIDAMKPLDAKRWELEEQLIKVKDNKEATEKAINDASADMWKCLPDAGLSLFAAMMDTKRRLSNESYYNNLPKAASEALGDVAVHMFGVQMKAVNALRADFTNKIKPKVAEAGGDEAKIRAAIRELWRNTMFEIIQALMVEGWEKTAQGLIGVASAATIAFFFEDVWPKIVEGIQKLQDMMPGPLKQLDVVALATQIVEKIITKGAEIAFTKIVIKIEGAVFKQ